MSDSRTTRLRARIDALSETQRRSLAERLETAGNERGAARLVGFVVLHDGSTPTHDGLRAFLADRVPEYMIPSRFVAVDRLPRTAAGKLDRRALAHAAGIDVTSDPHGRRSVGPRSETEAKLAAIWRDVLKLDDVGVDDDFFEIGGDSLLSIRVIARAGREGMHITPDRFFERPTVAYMAAAIDAGRGHASASRSRVALADEVGDAPLTPIQHWFVDAVPHHRDWWNQAYLLELGHELDAAQMGEIARELVNHHDALRLRLTCREGEWRQDFMAAVTVPPCRVVDVRALTPGERTARVSEECEREHASLRLTEGSLFRCVVFEGDPGMRRLLLVGHHLVLDSISWSVILEDIATLVTQAAGREALRLPEKTAPARAWAIALAERAATLTIPAVASHWASMPADPTPMPVDAELATTGDAHAGLNGDAALVTLTLGGDESRLLLHDAPRRLEAPVHVLLLAALLLAWRQWTGSDSLRLDVEGHGRDVLGDVLDVSRTVGWFTTVFPLYLALPRDHADGAEPGVGVVVRGVRNALDALPLRGAGHGLARYLAPDATTRAALAAQPRPAVLFNHLGAHDVALAAPSRLRVSDEPHGRARDAEAPRAYALEINSLVDRGLLVVTIEYSRRTYTPATVERLAGALRSALEGIAGGAPARVELPGVDASSLAIVADLLADLDDA